jgi:hypothetical protein
VSVSGPRDASFVEEPVHYLLSCSLCLFWHVSFDEEPVLGDWWSTRFALCPETLALARTDGIVQFEKNHDAIIIKYCA